MCFSFFLCNLYSLHDLYQVIKYITTGYYFLNRPSDLYDSQLTPEPKRINKFICTVSSIQMILSLFGKLSKVFIYHKSLNNVLFLNRPTPMCLHRNICLIHAQARLEDEPEWSPSVMFSDNVEYFITISWSSQIWETYGVFKSYVITLQGGGHTFSVCFIQIWNISGP